MAAVAKTWNDLAKLIGNVKAGRFDELSEPINTAEPVRVPEEAAKVTSTMGIPSKISSIRICEVVTVDERENA